jgi:MFS family permease
VTLVGALLGTYQNDRLGRRKVLIIGTLMCAALLACAMGSSAASNVNLNSQSSEVNTSNINKPASKAAMAFLILFGGAFGWGYLPLAPIYPSEVLSMEMRSTGLGIMVLSLNLACEFTSSRGLPLMYSLLESVCYTHR